MQSQQEVSEARLGWLRSWYRSHFESCAGVPFEFQNDYGRQLEQLSITGAQSIEQLIQSFRFGLRNGSGIEAGRVSTGGISPDSFWSAD